MKNRKWGMALIAALLCLCMALSACSNDADNDPNEVGGQDWRTWGLVVDSGTITRNGEDTAVLVCVLRFPVSFMITLSLAFPETVC